MSSNPETRRLGVLSSFSSLRYRDFRTLWISNSLSGMAYWTLMVGRGWLVYEITASPLWVGVITFASMITFLVVTPVAGLLADRIDRRKLILLTMGVDLLAALALALLAMTGAAREWHLALLAFVGGVASATLQPTAAALVPNQVPPGELMNAISLNTAARQGARLVGPGLAGPIMLAVGVEGVFWLAVGFLVLGLGQAFGIRTVSTGAVRSGAGVVENMAAGAVYAYRNQGIGLVLVLVTFHCALTMSFESLMPSFSRQVLHAGGATYSSLITAVGAGALVGTLAIAAVRSENRKGKLLLITGVASAIGPIALAASSVPALAIMSAAVMGASEVAFMAIATTFVQVLAPDALRGRISALFLMQAGGIMAFSNLWNGYMAERWNAPVVLLGTAAVFLAVLLAISVVRPYMRQLYRVGVQAAR